MTTSSTKAPAARKRTVETTTVREVMHPGIVSCSQYATAADVAGIMSTCRVHCVAVMGLSLDGQQDPVIWGIVSDLDLLAAMTDPARITAGDLARQPVVSIRPSLSIQEAAEAMVSNQTQHIVVVDPERVVPIGMLSSLDIANVIARPGFLDPPGRE